MEAVRLDPEDDTFAIDLVANPVVEEGQAEAILLTSADNPGMVIVGIAGEVVGAIPAAVAPAWHAFATRLAAENLVAAVAAEVEIEDGAITVGLHADPKAGYQTPGEIATARSVRARARFSRLHARATGRCRDCGEPLRSRAAGGRRSAARRAGATLHGRSRRPPGPLPGRTSRRPPTGR